MPFAAKVQCKGCGKPVVSGYCAACRAQGKGSERRPSSNTRLYGYRWQRESKLFLLDHPLCVEYPKGTHGQVVVLAECVDHVIPHKGNLRLFWDKRNWQPLCIPCNSRKAVAEEGALGR